MRRKAWCPANDEGDGNAAALLHGAAGERQTECVVESGPRLSTIDTEGARQSEPGRTGWRVLRPRSGAAALWFKITVRLENSPALIPDLEVERKVHLYCCNCQGAVVAHMPPFLTCHTHSKFLPVASQSKPATRKQTCFH